MRKRVRMNSRSVMGAWSATRPHSLGIGLYKAGRKLGQTAEGLVLFMPIDSLFIFRIFKTDWEMLILVLYRVKQNRFVVIKFKSIFKFH